LVQEAVEFVNKFNSCLQFIRAKEKYGPDFH
jgi:hypothetical protein